MSELKKRVSIFDKQMPVSNVIAVFGMSLLLGVGIGASNTYLKDFVSTKISQSLTKTPDSSTSDLAKQDFSLYWEVYNQLEQDYVDPAKLDAKKLFYGSVKGMVDSIGDSPTVFFDPTETAEYKKSQSGAYSGIGAELDSVNKMVVIIAPFDGSPAQKAGLEPQDIITKVNDKAIGTRTLAQVVTEIRGEAGTIVKITIVRPRENNKEYTYEITRGNVSAPSMELKDVSDGVAVVKISRFTESSLNEWTLKWKAIAAEIAQKKKSGEVKSLVIDLRNNPGGYFDAAIVLAGDFLPNNSIISYQRDKAGTDTSYATRTVPLLADIPVVVLINGSSASASEIFAGAMKFYKRATIIGEDSYGKGTAQIITPLADGSSLHLTISKWLLPNKEWINPESKIKPDREVVFDYEAREKGVDNQLDAAKKQLTGK